MNFLIEVSGGRYPVLRSPVATQSRSPRGRMTGPALLKDEFQERDLPTRLFLSRPIPPVFGWNAIPAYPRAKRRHHWPLFFLQRTRSSVARSRF